MKTTHANPTCITNSVSIFGMVPKIRNLKFTFSNDIPRVWFGQNAFITQVINALHLIFPLGERYFVRAVKDHLDCIEDPVLRKKAAAFAAQEVQHGREHERFFEILKRKGFQLEPYLSLYEKVNYDIIEKYTPRSVRLSMTAALEHYTASFAEFVLKTQLFKNRAHPVMADLFHWHAVEEIEHRSVAYDVMIAAKISYPVRILGLLAATLDLSLVWIFGAIHLIKQDPTLTFKAMIRLFIRDRAVSYGFYKAYFLAFIQYLKPGFHPSQIDNDNLAQIAAADLESRYSVSTN